MYVSWVHVICWLMVSLSFGPKVSKTRLNDSLSLGTPCKPSSIVNTAVCTSPCHVHVGCVTFISSHQFFSLTYLRKLKVGKSLVAAETPSLVTLPSFSHPPKLLSAQHVHMTKSHSLIHRVLGHLWLHLFRTSHHPLHVTREILTETFQVFWNRFPII